MIDTKLPYHANTPIKPSKASSTPVSAITPNLGQWQGQGLMRRQAGSTGLYRDEAGGA